MQIDQNKPYDFNLQSHVIHLLLNLIKEKNTGSVHIYNNFILLNTQLNEVQLLLSERDKDYIKMLHSFSM